MKPYGTKKGGWDTGPGRPRSGTRAHKPGGSYDMGPPEIARTRRRLKKKARQEGKILEEGSR